MYVFVYICTYVRMYVCMHVCIYVCMYGWLCVFVYACVYIRIYVCMYVCACVHVRMYVRSYLFIIHLHLGLQVFAQCTFTFERMSNKVLAVLNVSIKIRKHVEGNGCSDLNVGAFIE